MVGVALECTGEIRYIGFLNYGGEFSGLKGEKGESYLASFMKGVILVSLKMMAWIKRPLCHTPLQRKERKQ